MPDKTFKIPEIKTPPKFIQTRTAKMGRLRLARHIEGLADDLGIWEAVQDKVPEAWHTLEEDIWCEEPKIKLTLRLDASVAKFFRAMGPGYQARMNRVLATYAQMKIGEIRKENDHKYVLLKKYGLPVDEETRTLYLTMRESLNLPPSVQDLADRLYHCGRYADEREG